MGNINATPTEYATFLYFDFLKSLIPKNDKFSETSIIEEAPRQFNIMLEDLLINDKQFLRFKESSKNARTCIAVLLIRQATFSHILSTMHLNWSIAEFCEEWHKGTPTTELINKIASSDYVYSKGKFYQWNETCWEACFQSDVKINHNKFDFNLVLPQCDFASSEVDEARAWAQSKLDECKEAVNNFDVSALVSIVQNHEVALNRDFSKIPCLSSVVNFYSSSIEQHSSENLFTVRLPYDPSKEVTTLVSRFVSAFACPSKDIATNLYRFACNVTPALTLIIGPAASGKTTLCKIAQSLYGPFAVCFDADKAGIIDYTVARTCFFDNTSDLNKDFVANHPCSHLVFTSLEDPGIGDFYSGRKVFRLVLNFPISSDVSNPEIISKVNTWKQLGSLLGWCLQNTGPSDMSDLSINGSMESGNCFNQNCKNFNTFITQYANDSDINDDTDDDDANDDDADDGDDDDDNESKDENGDQGTSTKIFRLGATGVIEVTK